MALLLLLAAALLAPADAGSLVGPGAVGSYQGPTHGRRHGGYVRVSEPSVGFFVAGSSIKAMNGLYARVDPELQPRFFAQRHYHLAYRHDYTGWCMALVAVQRPGQNSEWLFIDNDGNDRLAGPGETIIPAAGEAWHHVHGAKKAGSEEAERPTGTAVGMPAEDDLEELPWQIVGIGSEDMMRKLRGYFNYYKHTVQHSIDGHDLPSLPSAAGGEDQSPPEGYEPPAAVTGPNAGELCTPESVGEVQKALQASVEADDRWAQASIFLAVARCHRAKGQPQEATRSLSAALGAKPRFREAILEQGKARLDAEEYQEAIHSFELLLRLDRQQEGLLDWLVLAHAHARRREAARLKGGSQVDLVSRETPHCVAWRQTGGCDPNGPREPSQDKPCDERVPHDLSGYCECKGAVGARAGESNCAHSAFTCAELCADRWPAGGGSQEAPAGPPCQSPEPPDWCSANHYKVLGLPCDVFSAAEEGESEQLKRAYKRRSLQVHPDKAGGSMEAFQRVSEAHMVLADAAKRKAFENGEDLERGLEDDGTEKPPHRTVIEKKYFPERFDFQPFGDPHADRRERHERRQKRLERMRQEQLAERAARGEEL